MTNEHLDCEETVRRASLYLDGRLSADSRQSIQEHLRSCDACVREYRRFGRLSRATHNLPQRRVVADLAQCVRERVADRREGVLASLGHGRVRFVAAGAAALVLITAGAWWIGFRMGRDVAGDAATPGVAEVASKEDSPKTDAAPSNESDQVQTASFETAGRGLLRDLAMIESVDPRARRPLLAAQVSYFDLADDAEKVLRAEPSPDMRELAQFVSGLAAELSGDNDIDWGAWRERAQSRGLFREPSGAPKRLRQRSERSPRRMQLVVEEAPNSPVSVGFQLLVVPHIVPGTDKIIMDVIPQSDALSGTGSSALAPAGFDVFTVGSGSGDGQIALPRVSSSTIATQVLLRSGQTAVLGGLMTDTISDTVTQLPLLGDIPLLGWLFKHKNTTKTRTSLIVFVTPQLIRSPEEVDENIRRMMREREEMVEAERRAIFGGGK